jgi:hypothetical protein
MFILKFQKSTLFASNADHQEPFAVSRIRWVPDLTKGYGDRAMILAEEFMRHSVECEQMAKFARDRENRDVWSRMAERWIRCAELARRLEPSTQDKARRKQQRRTVREWSH